MKQKLLIFIPVLVIVAVIIAGCVFTRFGYETPAYTVTQADGGFEVRHYGELTLVSVPMKRSVDDADGSFMRLFRYISKDNAGAEKISMTTPVLMSMDEKNTRMSFVMPTDTVAKGVPAPKGEGMRVEKLPAGHYAVHRFSGALDDNAASGAEKRLRDWMTAKKLATTGTIIVAGYDPPFTIPAMRRNEILLRLAD